MVALVINSPEQAYGLFLASMAGEVDLSDVERIEFGDWVNPKIHIPLGHSEITSPFMEAFLTSQTALYRLVAELKYGDGDVRHLTPDDLEAFQIKVQVTDGSSNFKEEIAKALENIGMKAIGSLSPSQIVGTVLGLALLTSGTIGFSTYLEHRKSVRVEEIQSTERQTAIKAMQFANKQEADLARSVIEVLKSQGGVSERAIQAAADSNGAKLKAATTVPEVEINGVHLTQGEAKELRSTARRRASRMIVEREMRVIQINTSEQARTSVAVEEVGTGKQYRVAFADRLIEDRDVEKLFKSLKERESVWLRLDVKEVGGEIRSVEIRSVVEPPGDSTQTASR